MRTWTRRWVVLALVTSGAHLLPALAAEQVSHPLITPYEGSTQGNSRVVDYDAYQLVTGLEGDNPVGRELQGKITRLSFYNPRDRSILEIFRNYETALREAGLEVLFTCADDACGPAYAASAWNRLNGMTAKTGADCRYLAGELRAGDAVAYVALLVGKTRHQIDIVEIEAMDTGMVTVDAAALGREIERTGRVAVYGIHFATDSATLQPASKPALDEVAALLRAMPELKIHVVGHTDRTGTFERNMTLSRERARAVVDELVRSYGIAATRLAPHGVGPLCPVGTNRDEDGRAQNRRVELVEQ